jgi:SET domain-containing protein
MDKKVGFQIPYEVRHTIDRGNGLFTAESLSKGTLIWRLVPKANALVFRGETELRAYLATLSSDDERRDFVDHTFHYAGCVIYILDDGKLMNHDQTPNVISDQGGNVYALRDIQAGEELLENYGSYEHPKWYYNLHDEVGAPHEYFDKDVVRGPTVEDEESLKTPG